MSKFKTDYKRNEKFELTRDFMETNRVRGYFQSIIVLLFYVALLWIISQIENIFVLSFLFIIIGIVLNKIFFPLHDCIHASLFPSKIENKVVGSILASFLGTTFSAITIQHFDHHKHFGTIIDPGADDYYVKFKSTKSFYWFIFSPLLGIIFLQKISDYLFRSSNHLIQKKTDLFEYIVSVTAFIVVQLLVAFTLTSAFEFSQLWRYPVFGFLPIVTVFLFLNRLRMFLEHGSLDYSKCDYTENKGVITRTIYGSTIEKLLLCGSDFNFHHEHHLYPGVPGWQLPRLHECLLKFNYDTGAVSESYIVALIEFNSYLNCNK